MTTATPRRLYHGGIEREYVLHLPTDPGRPLPLVLELHGGGGTGRMIERLGRFGALADRDGFAIACPSGFRRNWNDGRLAPRLAAATEQIDDVGFIAAVIDDVAQWVPIDQGRVYAVGMSNGAMMVGRLAGQLSDRIAAFAQVAGTVAADATSWWHPGRPVPLIQIHGTADPLVPYGGGPVGGARRRARGRGRGPAAGRGVVLGVEQWVAMVAANNGAAGPNEAHYPPDVTARAWYGPTPRSDVEQWRIEGGGHTWPGGPHYAPDRLVGPTSATFNATALIWRFLSAHTLA